MNFSTSNVVSISTSLVLVALAFGKLESDVHALSDRISRNEADQAKWQATFAADHENIIRWQATAELRHTDREKVDADFDKRVAKLEAKAFPQ